jgi:hypothetical protein
MTWRKAGFGFSAKILAMIVSLRHFLGWLVSVFRSREDLVLENLALRRQLLALHAQQPRRRLTALHKLFWVALRTFWSGWRKPLVLVTPRTVVNWHRGVSSVLVMDLKSQADRRAEACQQRVSRLDLSYGCRESDLGSAAHSRGNAQAGFRSIGKECLAMDPASAERSRFREAMADVPQKPSRSHCRNGFLHRPHAHVWCSAFSSLATTGGRSCIST